MRFSIALVVTIAALGASLASAGTTPTYTVTFTGSGSEHQLDQQKNIEDDGTCEAAEHVDMTATLAWTTSWTGFSPAARNAFAAPAQIAGSRVSGTDVKDACGLPLDEAPEGWVGQRSCDAELLAAGPPELSRAKKTATTLVLSVAAPPFAVPVPEQCPLNVRNDQLAGHLVVPLKRLQALKKGASLTFAVGSARPGPSDLYTANIDCSRPTKPYEGYRLADHCEDALTWSGSVKITRR